MQHKCRVCGENRSRIPQFNLRGQKYYIDELGKRWNGFMCGLCKNDEHYARPRKCKRYLGAALGPEIVIDPVSERKCRVCHERLPASKYFYHNACRSVDHMALSEDYSQMGDFNVW